MDNEMYQAPSSISDELYDDLLMCKVCSKPSLLKSLKRIQRHESFTVVEEIFMDEHKVCIILLILSAPNELFTILFIQFKFVGPDRKSQKQRKCLRDG